MTIGASPVFTPYTIMTLDGFLFLTEYCRGLLTRTCAKLQCGNLASGVHQRDKESSDKETQLTPRCSQRAKTTRLECRNCEWISRVLIF